MRIIAPLLLLLVACGVLLPSSKTVISGDGSSGIEGLITIGPTCPVARAEDPCPDKLYQATVQVYQGKTLLTQVTSDVQGMFRLSLEAGSYTLRPQTPAGQGIIHPVSREVPVLVEAGKFTQVTVQYDSGIR